MAQFFTDFINIIDVLLKLLEFAALIISVVTFFFLMMNGFSKALKHILSPCGMLLWNRICALIICRKSPIKKRMFIEFALLKTHGSAVVNTEWRSILNEFKSYYAEHENDATYTIPNCTVLQNEGFALSLSRYFEFFSNEKMKKAFGIPTGPIRWVLSIHINEAYATPTCLLTGLLTTYEESWSEFIKKYVSTAYISESSEMANDAILPNELYFTFAWLLWGPSYELKYKNDWAGLCQLSYGDESNSIPAVMDNNTNITNNLIKKFEENAGHRYGALLSVDVHLYENKAFYKNITNNINPENAYFYNKIEENSSSFAVQITDFVPCTDYKAKKYYCTAYVWILFELENDAHAFKPENSVAFFEHANLADMSTYQFLTETLIDKCLKHFDAIFSIPEYESRKYRFVCAMNTELENAFFEKFTEIISSDTERAQQFKERIILESKRSPASVFAQYDRFFSRNSSIHFEEVTIDNKDSLSDFARFYTETYMECFPNSDERETFDNFLYYLKQGEISKEHRYHILLAKNNDGNILGGGIFNYFLKPNAGVIEFIAVNQASQSSGIGTMIYQEILNVLSQDAYENNRQFLRNVFCEIDSPEFSQSSEKKYLHFWKKLQYKHLEFNYIQPALSAQQNAVDGLWLVVSQQNNFTESLPCSYVLEVIEAYMKYCMQIEEPSATPEYQMMKKELISKGYIKLSSIIP